MQVAGLLKAKEAIVNIEKKQNRKRVAIREGQTRERERGCSALRFC